MQVFMGISCDHRATMCNLGKQIVHPDYYRFRLLFYQCHLLNLGFRFSYRDHCFKLLLSFECTFSQIVHSQYGGSLLRVTLNRCFSPFFCLCLIY